MRMAKNRFVRQEEIIIMFNFISHRAEILASLVFAVRADIKDVKGLTAISFLGYLTRQQDSTFLIILAVPNNADF